MSFYNKFNSINLGTQIITLFCFIAEVALPIYIKDFFKLVILIIIKY